MSMRATFTTEFIYDGNYGYLSISEKMCQILGGRRISSGDMIGQIAGITKGLDLSESDIVRYIDDMVVELREIVRVPVKIIWLLEGGQNIVKFIKPNQK